MPVKVCMIGAAGRMGKAIIRCLLEGRVEGLTLHSAVDMDTCPALGADAGLHAGAPEAGVPITADLEKAVTGADVAIDFTFHTVAVEHALLCAKQSTAVVVGTTGMTGDEEGNLENVTKAIPVILAPNMSLGMNLLFCLVEEAAAALKGKGYDIEIVERHHRRKKDAPSGTALGLGKAAARGMQWDLNRVAVHGREGIAGERPVEQIAFHAVRGGDFVGDHTVIFAAEGESVELSHRATTRDTFAVGALQAAAWVKGQPPALYTMKDVLGL